MVKQGKKVTELYILCNPTNYFEKPYKANWFWSMCAYVQMHSKSLEEKSLNWGVRNGENRMRMTFALYSFNAIVRYFSFSHLWNCKGSPACKQLFIHRAAHSKCSRNTNPLPLGRSCQRGWFSSPWCAPGVSGSGPVALCLFAVCSLPSPSLSWRGFYGDERP